MQQLTEINFFTLIIMITFVTALSKANTTKLLKQQSEEVYRWHEELKDEIWRSKQ